MAIEFVTSRLPANAQTALRLANYFIIGVFLVYLMVMGTWLAWTSRVRSFQGIPEISYSWVTMSLPVGGGAAARSPRFSRSATSCAGRRPARARRRT